jgi:hypothetical protein
MTVETASLLAQVAEGAVRTDWQRRSSASQRIALQTLLDQGLVEVNGKGTVVITQTVCRGTEPTRRR